VAEDSAAWGKDLGPIGEGSEQTAQVEGPGPRELQMARLASQAPEIDGVTFLSSEARLEPGTMLLCRITGVRDGVDLEAEVVG